MIGYLSLLGKSDHKNVRKEVATLLLKLKFFFFFFFYPFKFFDIVVTWGYKWSQCSSTIDVGFITSEENFFFFQLEIFFLFKFISLEREEENLYRALVALGNCCMADLNLAAFVMSCRDTIEVSVKSLQANSKVREVWDEIKENLKIK